MVEGEYRGGNIAAHRYSNPSSAVPAQVRGEARASTQHHYVPWLLKGA